MTYKAVNNYSELLVAKAKAAKCYGSCREEIYKLTEKYAFHLQNPSTESNASHWLEAQVKEVRIIKKKFLIHFLLSLLMKDCKKESNLLSLYLNLLGRKNGVLISLLDHF